MVQASLTPTEIPGLPGYYAYTEADFAYWKGVHQHLTAIHSARIKRCYKVTSREQEQLNVLHAMQAYNHSWIMCITQVNLFHFRELISLTLVWELHTKHRLWRLHGILVVQCYALCTDNWSNFKICSCLVSFFPLYLHDWQTIKPINVMTKNEQLS